MKKYTSVIILSILFMMPLSVVAETVIFNPNSKIYHKENCVSASKCKVCIKIDKLKAKKQGGRPCKRCGG